MSRSFFIGFVAALVILVWGGQALGANNAVQMSGPTGQHETCIEYDDGDVKAGPKAVPRGRDGFMLSTIGCSSLRARPCVESISTKYTMFLPVRRVTFPMGDTATHEGWQAHQACTLKLRRGGAGSWPRAQTAEYATTIASAAIASAAASES